MKNWRNSEPFLNRSGECRRCETSGAMRKVKEVVSKAADKFKKLWDRRKRNRDNDSK